MNAYVTGGSGFVGRALIAALRAKGHPVRALARSEAAAAARASGVRRLVHVSTEAVLAGGGPIRQADETRPRPAGPVGMYPRSKAEAAALVKRSQIIQ